MIHESMIQMNLQLFAEGSDGSCNGANGTDGAGNGAQGVSGGTGGNLTAEQIASIVAAVEARQQRAGNAAMKSIADQYGMTPDEVGAILKQRQDENAKKLSPEAKAQVDAANAKVQTLMLSTEIAKLGASMGLVDADVAMQLIDKTKITYKDDKVEGVKEQLEALKSSKAYLFTGSGNGGGNQGGSWGQQRQGGAPGAGGPTSLRDALRQQYNVK